jgi:HK97 family phage major capsid protein
MPKLSEKIEAASEKLVGLKDQIVALEKQLEDEPENETTISAMEELTGQIEKASHDLSVLKKAEHALMESAEPVQKHGAPAVIKSHPKGEAGADLIVAIGAATMESHITKKSVDAIIAERYEPMFGDKVKAVQGVVTKAKQDPGFTNVAGWAQELTRESYGAFMDLLQPESVVARLPLTRFDFGGSSKITVPQRLATPATPNLAADFRAEGDPIRVGAATLGKKDLTPKTMGIIGTFSMELFRRSTPNILEAIRRWMIEDTAVKLDGHFLSNTARSATDPGGILENVTAVGAGAATAAGITADIRTVVQAMAGANLGRRPVWILNPAQAWGVSLALTAAGTPAFPEMQNNVLLGIPVITSTTVPAGSVYLVDAAEIVFAGGSPEFMATDIATLHEEGVQADVKPIVDDSAAPGVTANPVRSLYQTYSSALRTVWELDYAVMRPGAVGVITGAAW